jgi:hypothetical protein
MPVPILDTTDADQLRRQFSAWMQGVEARLLDIPLHKNPHPARSAQGDAWENAWERVDRGLRMNGRDLDAEHQGQRPGLMNAPTAIENKTERY